MATKLQLGKLDKIALAEAFVSHSDKTRNINDLNELIVNAIGESEASKCVFNDSRYLFENYNTGNILKKGWDIIVNKLLPPLVESDFGKMKNYNFDKFYSESGLNLWNMCFMLLSLWKFVYARKERRTIECNISRYKPFLKDYDTITPLIKCVVFEGTLWLDHFVETEHHWELPSVYSDDYNRNGKPVSIQDQSMYLFARSHLTYSDIGTNSLSKVPIEPVIKLLEAREGNYIWPDIYYPSSKTNSGSGSIKSTCFALTALFDILQDQQIGNRDIEREVEDLSENAIRYVGNAQAHNGSWPVYFNERNREDIQSTGYSLYLLDRFANAFNIPVYSEIFIDSQMWLSRKITSIINESDDPNIISIENVSRAVPPLARSCPHLSVRWYRNVFRYLFENGFGNEQKLNKSDIWKLYATTEMLRRPEIASYLERVI